MNEDVIQLWTMYTVPSKQAGLFGMVTPTPPGAKTSSYCLTTKNNSDSQDLMQLHSVPNFTLVHFPNIILFPALCYKTGVGCSLSSWLADLFNKW